MSSATNPFYHESRSLNSTLVNLSASNIVSLCVPSHLQNAIRFENSFIGLIEPLKIVYGTSFFGRDSVFILFFGYFFSSHKLKLDGISEASDRFLWSEYGEKLHPAFGSWFSRTLLYILQGVESNLDLAQEKMFFRDVQVRKIAHIFRKVPPRK